MTTSGGWTPDQTFKCIDFNCGCELKIVTPPPQGVSPLFSPRCLCGGPMKRWPEAATRSDRFNDV